MSHWFWKRTITIRSGLSQAILSQLKSFFFDLAATKLSLARLIKPLLPFVEAMGKRVGGKRTVMAFAKDRQPPIHSSSTDKMTFKEVKRRSVIAGLRVLKAPAVPWYKTGLGTGI